MSDSLSTLIVGNWNMFSDDGEDLHSVATFTSEGRWRIVRLSTDTWSDIVLMALGNGRGGRIEKILDERPAQVVLRVDSYEMGAVGSLMSGAVTSTVKLPLMRPLLMLKRERLRFRVLRSGAVELVLQRMTESSAREVLRLQRRTEPVL